MISIITDNISTIIQNNNYKKYIIIELKITFS